MKWMFGLLSGVMVELTAEVVELETYVRQMKWESEEITQMMRSDTLLQMGDTRDLIYGMLHYRFHVDQITHLTPMNLLQYGCQCQIMTQSSFGQSKDPLDEACVAWHQCRKCLTMDQNLNKDDRSCNPKSDLYQIGVNVDTGELSCQLSKKNACEETLCQCDKMLVSNLMKNIESYDQSRNIAEYNYKQECKKTPKNSPSFKQPVVESVITMNSGPSGFTEKGNPAEGTDKTNTSQLQAFSHHAEYDMCCGEFPNIRPFSSRQGKRKCCGEKVFEWKRRECCPDNRVAAFGDC